MNESNRFLIDWIINTRAEMQQLAEECRKIDLYSRPNVFILPNLPWANQMKNRWMNLNSRLNSLHKVLMARNGIVRISLPHGWL